MGKLYITIGLIGLCHAAYSATQHRAYLRLIESQFTSLPRDILVETLLSVILCLFGIITLNTKFKPIQITSEWEHKTWDNIGNRSNFYSFNHRGKLLFSSQLDATTADLTREYFKTTNKKLTAKEKQLKQDELIRQRLNKACKEDSSSSSDSSENV